MLNFAVIGTGWITDSFVKGAEASRAWKLTGVYSRKHETAAAFGAKYGCDALFTDLGSLTADPAIHAVYIASPNSLHYEQARFVLSKGRHVILEKPATSTAAELDSLFEVARANGVFLLEAFRHIQEVNFKALQRALPRLGTIYGASLNYATYSSRYNAVLAGETPNIFNLAFSAGSLVDIGVYPICAAVALFGRPESQTYKPIVIPSGADAGGVVVLNYERFAVSINASKCYATTAPSEVYGEKGTLVVNATADIDRVTFIGAGGKEREELAGEKAELNLQEEAAEFARIINEKDEGTAKRLEEISKIVVAVTQDLRHQNGLLFDVEKREASAS